MAVAQTGGLFAWVHDNSVAEVIDEDDIGLIGCGEITVVDVASDVSLP